MPFSLLKNMSNIFHVPSRRRESTFDVPATPSRSPDKQRWHSAFATISYSGAFLSLFNCKKKRSSEVPVSTPSIVELFVEPHLPFPNLDRIVKEKNLDQLGEFGGVEGVADVLKTDAKNGIHGAVEDVARRRGRFGSNTYQCPLTKSFLYFVLEAFKDTTVLILVACAILPFGFGIKKRGLKVGWYGGGSIVVAVFRVISVSAVKHSRQNRRSKKLSSISNNIKVEVVRDGHLQQISMFEIVVGDVVCLKIGDQVPADGLLLNGHSLIVDESSLTGESDHVEVNTTWNPFLFSGTTVAGGYAQMLVTSVGMNTTWGQIMSTISHDINEQTHLQARLDKLNSTMEKAGLAVAFLLLVVLVVRYFTGKTEDEDGNQANDIMNAVVGIIAAAVNTIDVAIPEGLPMSVKLILAYSMKQMMADKVMVRKLSVCEAMGSVTVICTDKTGTLTLNMMVTKFWLGKELVEDPSAIATNILQLIQQGVALTTDGSIYKATPESEFDFSGNHIEKALLAWAVLELDMDMESIKQNHNIIHIEAFNSVKKRSGVSVRNKADNTLQVHWKGAAEMILAMCSSYYDASGSMKNLDDAERMKFELIIEGMAASSHRCLAFAHKQIPEEEQKFSKNPQKLQEDSLTLIGVVGIKEPCRPGARKAVEDCQYAGVNVKMVTGDNAFTARAIATDCGILRPDQDMNGAAIIESEVFRSYTEEERMEKVDKMCVMARSSPFDKLLIVQCLRQKGHVVAFTGDGTNDAPALKEADVGLSMGIQGTEVAKESSDIIILDDNFASVAMVLRWGRCVYNNIQKFIQFQLTANVAALVINFVDSVSTGEVPLTAVQLLWVNLIMDTLGALALATEQPTKEAMEKPPVGKTQPLISNIMWRNILAQALYQIAVLSTLHFKGESIFGFSKKVNHTLIFNTFVLCQVFNEFNTRQLKRKNVFKGLHKNKLFLGIIGIIIILQAVMVEFLKKFADTERLNWGQWAACIGIATASWPICCIVKCIPVSD